MGSGPDGTVVPKYPTVPALSLTSEDSPAREPPRPTGTGPGRARHARGGGGQARRATRHPRPSGVRSSSRRPNRQRRSLKGKSDPQTPSRPPGRPLRRRHRRTQDADGNVESMRVFRVARSSARKARTQALNQMRNLVSTAPDPIRAELRGPQRLLSPRARFGLSTRRKVRRAPSRKSAGVAC